MANKFFLLFLVLISVHAASAFTVYDVCAPLNLTSAACVDYIYTILNTDVQPQITYEQNVNVTEILKNYVSRSELDTRLLAEKLGIMDAWEADVEEFEDLIDILEERNSTSSIQYITLPQSSTTLNPKNPYDSYLELYIQRKQMEQLENLFNEPAAAAAETSVTSTNTQINTAIDNRVMPVLESLQSTIKALRDDVNRKAIPTTSNPVIAPQANKDGLAKILDYQIGGLITVGTLILIWVAANIFIADRLPVALRWDKKKEKEEGEDFTPPFQYGYPPPPQQVYQQPHNLDPTAAPERELEVSKDGLPSK